VYEGGHGHSHGNGGGHGHSHDNEAGKDEVQAKKDEELRLFNASMSKLKCVSFVSIFFIIA